MDIIVEFQGRKSPGVECNGVQIAIGSCDGKDSGECIVRGINLDFNLSIQKPMGKDWSCGESLFKCFKGRTALIRKVPGGTLMGEMHKWNCDFGISINEVMVKVGETEEEGLDNLDFLGFQPVLDNLDFVQGHGEAFQGQMYPRYSQEVAWNSHLSAQAKSL